MTAGSITGSTFSTNSPQRALEVQAHDAATVGTFTVSANTFTDNGIHISFSQDNSASLTFKILNNVMTTGNPLHAINVANSALSTASTIVGTIAGNTIGNAGVTGSGSSTGNGIRVFGQGQAAWTLLIDNNVVRQTPKGRAIEVSFIGSTTTSLGIVSTNDVTITNNDVATNGVPADFPLAAIFLAADNQGSPARVRADVRNNTVPATANTYDYPTFDGFGAQLVYMEVTTGADAQLVDNSPASANAQAEVRQHAEASRVWQVTDGRVVSPPDAGRSAPPGVTVPDQRATFWGCPGLWRVTSTTGRP